MELLRHLAKALSHLHYLEVVHASEYLILLPPHRVVQTIVACSDLHNGNTAFSMPSMNDYDRKMILIFTTDVQLPIVNILQIRHGLKEKRSVYQRP